MVSQETFQHLWRFTDDDLNANRQGRLSDRQIEAQKADLALMVKVGLIAVAVVVGIVMIIVVVIVGDVIMAPVLWVVAAFIVGLILQYKRRAEADLRTGEVQVMQGTFQLERKITRSATQKKASGAREKKIYYYLHVGEQKFQIRKEVFFELTDSEGEEIAVYYLDRSKRIVAAEMV